FSVECRQNILAIFSFRRLVRRFPTRWSIVKLFGVDGHSRPTRKRSNVPCQPSDCAGLLVRLPVPFLIRDTFERLTGISHFLVEFTEHRLADSHGLPL